MLLLWYSVLMKLAGPFYSSRVDPEFIYLFNGLSCALGKFQNIGHIDLPGTPFHMLTGLFIHIVYFFTGKGDLASDVIANPEKYLTGCSLLLILIGAVVSYFVSYKVFKLTQKPGLSLIIGSLLLLFSEVNGMTYRYMPDFLLFILVLLLAIPIFRYLFDDTYSSKRFAISTGIITGIGVITKMSLLPIVFLPFLMVEKVKNKILFILFFTVSAFLSFLPIIKKQAQFRDFLFGMATHDGLYGTGEKSFLNIGKIAKTFIQFYQDHEWFVFLMAGLFIWFTGNKILKITHIRTRENRFFIGTFIALIFAVLLSLKHYKSYYIAPFIELGILTFVTLWMIFENSGHRKFKFRFILTSVMFFYLYFHITEAVNLYSHLNQQSKLNTFREKNIKKMVHSDDYRLLETTWQPTIIFDGGFAFGLSYVANRFTYYNDFYNNYPTTLIWEGNDKPPYMLRLTPFMWGKMFYSGKNIFVVSSPSNNETDQILNFISRESEKLEIHLNLDTVYAEKENKTFLLKFSNNQNWHLKTQLVCGFEVFKQGCFSDDGLHRLPLNENSLNAIEANSGTHSLMLQRYETSVPFFSLATLSSGDFVFISYKIKAVGTETKPDALNIWLSKNISLDTVATQRLDYPVDNDWYLVQQQFRIESVDTNKIEIALQNNSSGELLIDDLTIEHFSDR